MPFRRRLPQLLLAQEHVDPDEDVRAREFTAELRRKMVEAAGDGVMRRAVQPKHHGCVKAEVVIGDDVPSDLRVGLFAEPRTHPAWIRFANQSPQPQPDGKRDIRGMAIKLHEVAGRTLAEREPHSGTLDLILISTPVFVTADPASFFRLRRATDPLSIPRAAAFFLNPLDPQLRTLFNAVRAMRKHGNPLSVRYWSATPYRFGSRAAKLSAIPRFEAPPRLRKRKGDDFLRENMTRTLAERAVEFDLAVQIQTDAAAMPIEDAGKRWDEEQSPFRKVATIRIPKQEFDTPAQQQRCENTAFDVWRTLDEHRPLGGVNRARRLVYAPLANLRRQHNRADLSEPAGPDVI